MKGTTQTDAPAFVLNEAQEMMFISQSSEIHHREVVLRFRFMENGRYYSPVATIGRTDEDFEDFGIECIGSNGMILMRKRVFGEERYFEREEAGPGNMTPELAEITEERYRSLT